MFGAGFSLSSDMEKTHMGYKLVNESIVVVRIRDRQRNSTTMQVYATITQDNDEEI